jgi:hypothetical protein
MKQLAVTILFISFLSDLYSQVNQTNNLILLFSDFDTANSIQIIPKDALSGKYDALMLNFEFDTHPLNRCNPIIKVYWQSQMIDGEYELVITPKQIYLRSNHENPNPNYLYWLADLKKEQYEIIKSRLSKKLKKIKNFKKEKYIGQNWTDLQYQNFSMIMKMINKELENDTIEFPDYTSFICLKSLWIVNTYDDLNYKLEEIEVK